MQNGSRYVPPALRGGSSEGNPSEPREQRNESGYEAGQRPYRTQDNRYGGGGGGFGGGDDR